MDRNEVTLHHGETYQIVAESHDPITYFSEDMYHANVNSKGLVTAVCVGETDIKLNNGKDEKLFHVTVTPTNFCITEPDVTIGESKSSLLQKFGEPDMDEEEDGSSMMTYLYSDYATMMMFLVDEEDGLLAYMLGGMNDLAPEMRTFLSERYLYIGTSNFDDEPGDIYINALTENEATLEVIHAIIQDQIQMSVAVYSTPDYLNDDYLMKKSFSKFSKLARK
jgi:hypothetical protein